MKRILIATAIALLATTAHAQLTDLSTHGQWTTFAFGPGLCGVRTDLTDGQSNAQLMVKFERGGQGLFVQAFKNTWDFNDQHMKKIHARFTFDSAQYNMVGTAVTAMNGADAKVEFQIANHATAEFLELFSDGAILTIDWLHGNEPRWAASLDGSRHAGQVFSACVGLIGGQVVPPTTGSLQ